MSTPTIAQLQRAITIAEQIEKLQTELASLVGGSSSMVSASKSETVSLTTKAGGRTMSPATIAKMRASQQARRAKAKEGDAPVAKTPSAAAKKTKRKLSPEGRARIVAAQKARHAAAKKAAK